MYIKAVIPAVLKRESRLVPAKAGNQYKRIPVSTENPECPIENLGHDEKYSSQELTPGELLILTLVSVQFRFWPAFAGFYISNIYALTKH
jgi:hypothetical protein